MSGNKMKLVIRKHDQHSLFWQLFLYGRYGWVIINLPSHVVYDGGHTLTLWGAKRAADRSIRRLNRPRPESTIVHQQYL